MKRPATIALFLVITAGAIALSANWITAFALDAKLAPLLTRQLGLPVTLAPIRADLLGLRARSAKLVMGQPSDPAVIAQDVEVTISLPSLLKGEVRLQMASASHLMVRPTRWPSSGEPPPDNYQFLDQWIPADLHLERGSYVSDQGEKYPLQDVSWRRTPAGGAATNWVEQRAGKSVKLSAALASLQDLLHLDPISLALDIEAQDLTQSRISITADIQPDAASGYTLKSTIEAAGISATIVAGNKRAWRLPDHSETKIATLAPAQLQGLINSYLDSGTATDTEALLAKAVPELSFAPHRGTVTIRELRLGDETLRNGRFDFSANEQGLHISSLHAEGPAGILAAQLQIHNENPGWALELSADIKAKVLEESIASQYLDADWLWHTGHTSLNARGDTWNALLASLTGELAMEGFHRGQEDTPVTLKAHLDRDTNAFSLEHVEIALGTGRITGTASLSNTKPRVFTADVEAQQLQLDFLLEPDEKQPQAGIAIPNYLDLFPGIVVYLKGRVRGLHFPGVSMSAADFTLQRRPRGGRLLATITGMSGGKLDIQLDAKDPPDDGKTDISLVLNLDELDIPQMFEQETLFHSRSSGTIVFTGRGLTIDEVFRSMEGKAGLTLNLRSDDNWTRQAREEEQIQFSGDATMVIDQERILGLEISRIDINSTEQDITGKLSVVAEREPWMIAELQSQKLDIPGLRSLLPKSTKEVDERDTLNSLRKMGSMRLSLNAKSVLVQTTPLSNVELTMSSAAQSFAVDQFDFTLEDSHLNASGEITWQGDRAAFSATASTSNFNIDRFLILEPEEPVVPVTGSASLKSAGSTFSELVANLTGDISLASTDPAEASRTSARQLEMKIRHMPDGMRATIEKLHWADSELAGNVRYYNTTPPRWEIDVDSGNISLVPWEKTEAAPQAPSKKATELGLIDSAAKRSSQLLGRVLSTPQRLLSGPGEAPAGDKYFSTDPLPFKALQGTQAHFRGKLDSVTGTEQVVRNLNFDGRLDHGRLSVDATAGHLNGGKASVKLLVDSAVEPASVRFQTQFERVGGTPGRPGFPKSGVVDVDSRGNSTAQLAGNLSGQVFVEIGEGPFNFDRLTLINADVASKALRTLIPGMEKTQPRLECGMSMAEFKEGLGVTPFGYAARTNQANLIGRIEVDLKKELLQLRFDSRSREGVGLSVGSIFANTVQIRGPLTEPRIVPQTASLVVRGWAAFMTVGLSVVGESVLKRALASENPCKAIKKDIQKEVCSSNQRLASSPMVCPGRRSGR